MKQEALEVDYSHLDITVCGVVLRNHVPPLQGYQAIPQTWGSDATIGAAFSKTAMVELEIHEPTFPNGGSVVLPSCTSVFCDLHGAGMARDMTQNFRQIGL